MSELKREPIDMGDGKIMFDDEHTHADILRYVVGDHGADASTLELMWQVIREAGGELPPKVGDGTPDAALAIGEHAFRAGWAACVTTYGKAGHLPQGSLDSAWSAYEPPEDIKALS